MSVGGGHVSEFNALLVNAFGLIRAVKKANDFNENVSNAGSSRFDNFVRAFLWGKTPFFKEATF